MKIAACLIVKDAEATIERCLASVRPFVDYVCVYDTGSTDGTVSQLRKLDVFEAAVMVDPETGAKVGVRQKDGTPVWGLPAELTDARERADWIEALDGRTNDVPLAPIVVKKGNWRDDFAWAREQSFKMAPKDADWLLWLDDDDRIEGAEWLRQMAATAPPELDGFVFQYDYARDEQGNTVCVLWRERLMRRSAGYTWRNPVHEVLVPPAGKPAALISVPPDQARYVHERPPDRYAPDRNLKILERHVRETEKRGEEIDPRTLAYLGTEHMAHGDFQLAARYLELYLQHPHAGWSDERMQVHHKLALCLRVIGNPHAAVHVELQAHAERDDWAETAVGLADSFAMLGNWPRVEREARRALAMGMPQSALILNPLEFTFVPLVRIAEACIETGRPDEALGWIEKAEQLLPDHPLVRERRDQYERARYENALVQAMLVLREAAVRHDENLKALRLVEAAPYVISEHPEIVKARADQREMCRHFLEPEEYLRWYADEPKESSLTDEHIDQVGEWFGRVKGLVEGLREQEQQLGRKPVVLDLGCNDWWMGEHLARAGGWRCDGVELNRRSYELALERVERFARDATIVHGDLHDAKKLLAAEPDRGGRGDPFLFNDVGYDAVVLFEVIEHVPDIQRTLKVCESLLTRGGRVYLSTPNGAFEQGNLPNWHVVQRKGHLRAIPMHELAETVAARGEIEACDFTNDDRVTFLAYTPKRRKGKVVFYAGAAWEPWSPTTARETGIGGSETALAIVSTLMTQAGYEVKVYSGAEPTLVAPSAVWRPHTAWDPTEEADLLVVSRRPDVFDNPLGARATALWCHDHSYPDMTLERADRMTHVVTLSDWERARYERLYPFLADRLTVIRNGITLRELDQARTDRFPDAGRTFGERLPRCVYSSSADRGLDVMLTIWPRIREQAPGAELHIFYGWETFDRVALHQPQLHAYKALIAELADKAGGEEGGVFFRGRLGQRALAEEMQQARVWTYPTAFLETSCIGAMEARAAGLPIVTSRLGAIAETVGDHGILHPWADDEDEPHNQTPEYQDAFVTATVDLLTDWDAWTKWHQRARRGVAKLDWSHRVREWEQLVPARARARRRATVAA